MRARHGGLSLEVPVGFRDQSTIQLMRDARTVGGKPDPRDFPISYTLTRDRVGKAPDPLLYLKSKLVQLKPRLSRYHEELCEKTELAGHPAARARFTFVAEYELVQLVLVWFAGDDLLTATVTTTRAGVDEAWKALEEISRTVRVDEPML